ncbi:hypothetical protein BJ986_002002 [Phycicoccus badiiscoriae]|uniref:Integral membrane protein n=1 Tax=Pedococcus badiiscoriae TaxID=642776 RepID=A0A852WMP3_9MICO|nr:DUF6350 family protein [Pedococcus badiiscoriae]NYG07515.1 hypothetical protein [Pedococcus badiiscoriae]
MTVMEMLRGGTVSTDGGPGLVEHRRAMLAGALAAAGSASVFVLPALLVWVAAPESTVSWTSSLGVGASLWLLACGAHLSVGIAQVTVVPLLALAVNVAIGSWAAMRAARETAEARTIRLVGDTVHRPLALALGAWTAGYAACALLWVLIAFLAGPSPVVWTLVLPVLGVPALSAAIALARLVTRRPELAGPGLGRPRWLPDAVRRALRPGLEGAGALLGAAMVLCVLFVVLHFDRVSHLQGELAPGFIGGVVLTLGQLAVLPNLALWAVSFVAGTGFSAVQGASATWTGSRTSLLPMVPVFGALPQPGAFPGVLPVVVLLPVAVGALVGWRSLRAVARLSTERTKLTVAGAAVLVAAGTLGLLDMLGGSSLGVARLSHIGAPAGLMTLALLVELGIGASLVLAWDRWKLRR